MNEFLYGIDSEMVRKRRLAYLGVGKAALVEVANKYLCSPSAVFKDVVFGNCQEDSVLNQMKSVGWKVDEFASKLGGGEEEDSDSD